MYFAALLRSLGCTAHASAFAEMFDDDVAVQRELKTLDLEDPEALSAQTARFATWAGTQAGARADGALCRARFRRRERRWAAEAVRSAPRSERGSGFRHGAIAALDEVYERYDGRGFPAGRAGHDLTVAARVVHVAEQAVMAHYDGGEQAAARHVARLAGGHLDPDICASFAANIEPILATLEAPDMLAAALAAEPPPAITVPAEDLDRLCLGVRELR